MRKPKEAAPMDRTATLERLRRDLAEHFDIGFVVCSWDEGGTTYHMHTRWGNEYAVENLSEKASELLFPPEEATEEIS
jgi:hypothetical protein